MTTPPSAPAPALGPRPDQATIIDAYAHLVKRQGRPDGWDTVALLVGNLEAATIMLLEAHGDCRTPACPTYIPLRHAVSYLTAFQLFMSTP